MTDKDDAPYPVHLRSKKSEHVAVCGALFEDSFFTNFPQNVRCHVCAASLAPKVYNNKEASKPISKKEKPALDLSKSIKSAVRSSLESALADGGTLRYDLSDAIKAGVEKGLAPLESELEDMQKKISEIHAMPDKVRVSVDRLVSLEIFLKKMIRQEAGQISEEDGAFLITIPGAPAATDADKSNPQ